MTDVLELSTDIKLRMLMQAHDWSATPLGPMERWPLPLRTLLDVMLGSNQPMFLAWGPERTLIYNDPYAEILARKHPDALGRPFLDVWHEIRDDLVPIVEQAYRGEPVQMDDITLVMERKGYPEEAHFAFSYTPVRDEDDGVVGFFCACQEITGQVMAERKLRESEARAREDAERVRLALDAGAIIGTWFWDLPSDRFTVDEAFARSFGLDPALGRQGLSLGQVVATVHPDDVEGLQAAIAEVVERGGAYAHQYRVRRQDGRYYWIEANGRVDHGPDGTPLRFPGVLLDVEERRRAEASLRASEVRYRQIVEGADDFAIITQDEHGIVTGWNRGAERITGWPRDEAVGQPGAIIFTPEDREAGAPEHEMNRAASGERALNERWHLRRDGTRFWGSGLMMRLEAEAGGYLKMFRDATAEHEAEAALRESEERFRHLADAVPQIVWTTDAEGRTEFFNRQWTNYTGVPFQPSTAAEVAASRVHPDDEAATLVAFEEARRTGGTFEVEHRICSAAGEWRWFLVRAEPQRDRDTGAVVRWFGSSTDIHDRKLAEAGLRELANTLEARVAERTAEREQLARIVDATGTLIQALDAEYHWIALNRATAEVLAQLYGRAPFLGESLLDYLGDRPEHLAEARAPWERALGGESLSMVGEFGDPSFQRRFYELTFDTLQDNTGRVTGAFMVGMDVTDRLRDQARLAEAEAQLRQSQKMDAMGQLTGGVAHDFNNLLTPIVAVLDRLQRQAGVSEREQRLIAGAAQSAERARTLVQRLLAFARRQPLQPVAVDVAELVRGMADLVASTTGPQIQVAVEVAEDLPAAKGDPNQLEMALLNLAVNARDAMPEGGTLRISATAETVETGRRPKSEPQIAPGRYVRLSVADTGVGMDEATLARAVEPFFSTKGVGQGTGLGLSMVHGLASQLGGTLAITSRPGLGTNVEFWLPQSDVAPEAPTPEPVTAPNRLRGTALLVDDEEAVRFSTADMLGELGYSVLEVASAEEALAALRNGASIDLVVTDHLMPGMTGTDLARTVQARHPGVPVLVVSGYAESEGIEPDLPRLAKPFRRDELAASLAGLTGPGLA